MRTVVFVVMVAVLVATCALLSQHERRHDVALVRPQLPVTTGAVLDLPVFSMTSTTPLNRALRHNIILHKNLSKFSFRVLNESAARRFVHKHCPASAPEYDNLVPIAFKADLARLCMLFVFGGTWLDDDLMLQLPLNSYDTVPGELLLIEDSLYTPPALDAPWRYGIWNAFMIVRRRRHPFIGCALQLATHRVRNQFRGRTTVSMTGPQMVSECIPANADVNIIGYIGGKNWLHASTWADEPIVRHVKVPRNKSVPHYQWGGRWFYH
ncbi:MAG: hypothetical protein CL678_00580 [Bdellovibrionaceae bacterium]|nr:hypothetical protein [Pseudobdellovibrionaceae bacterium]